MRKFILPLAVVAFALALAWVGGVAAQEAMTSTASGTIVGNGGGSHLEWNVPVEPNTDVTLKLTYVPCAPSNTVAFSVYAPDGMLASGEPSGSCSRTAAFNSASNDAVMVKLSYYEHGQGLWWVIEADGADLGQAQLMGGEAMAEEPAEAEEMAETEEAAETEEMAETDEAAETEEMAETDEAAEAEDMAEEPAADAGTVTLGKAEGTLLGTLGGAHAKYDVNLTGGQRYAGVMTYYMDQGGVWPAVGFAVWGPNGLEAISHSMHGMPATVDFVASETGGYTIDVFNYHPGRTMTYILTGMPVAPMAAEGM
jgi:hypothetical protein